MFHNGETVDLREPDARFQFHAEGYATMKLNSGSITRLSPSAEIQIYDSPDGANIYSKPILHVFAENWDMSMLQPGMMPSFMPQAGTGIPGIPMDYEIFDDSD